jgi:hypothetical protein
MDEEISSARLRYLEEKLFTVRSTAGLLGISTTRVHQWRHGRDTLTSAQLQKLKRAVLDRTLQLVSFTAGLVA